MSLAKLHGITRILIFLLAVTIPLFASAKTKNILIVVEGKTDIKSFAIADGRQLANLMGHFNTKVTVEGVEQYKNNDLNNYDFIFYIGYKNINSVPRVFLNNVVSTEKPVIWLNTGIIEFSKEYDLKKIFGFTVASYDTVT